jgi:predicted GNAT superfamily acetyltransferase
VDRGDVIDLDGAVAGFVFTFGPGSAYDGANYRAFSARYGVDFYYLDRIVIADGFRRQGLAGRVYDEIERIAAPYSRLTLDVTTVPVNEASLAFHHRRGFVEVGTLVTGTPDGEPRTAALLAKELGGEQVGGEQG